MYAHIRKEITFYVFLGEKRDPSEIYANSNLRNLTHITQKPSYVYLFIGEYNTHYILKKEQSETAVYSKNRETVPT
jgi:hypothetical protein